MLKPIKKLTCSSRMQSINIQWKIANRNCFQDVATTAYRSHATLKELSALLRDKTVWQFHFFILITYTVTSYQKWSSSDQTCFQVIRGRLPSVLWCCWMGIRKSIRAMMCWCGYLMERCADCLHMVQLIPLPSPNPIISCLIYIQTGFTFLVLAYPICPGKEAIKWM